MTEFSGSANEKHLPQMIWILERNTMWIFRFLLRSCCMYPIYRTVLLKFSKKAKIRKRYKLTKTSHTREPRGQPFPGRWPQGCSNEQDKKAWQTRNINNKKDPHRLGTVSKNIFTGRLKLYLRYQPHSYFKAQIKMLKHVRCTILWRNHTWRRSDDEVDLGPKLKHLIRSMLAIN